MATVKTGSLKRGAEMEQQLRVAESRGSSKAAPRPLPCRVRTGAEAAAAAHAGVTVFELREKEGAVTD